MNIKKDVNVPELFIHAIFEKTVVIRRIDGAKATLVVKAGPGFFPPTISLHKALYARNCKYRYFDADTDSRVHELLRKVEHTVR